MREERSSTRDYLNHKRNSISAKMQLINTLMYPELKFPKEWTCQIRSLNLFYHSKNTNKMFYKLLCIFESLEKLISLYFTLVQVMEHYKRENL